MAKDFFFFFCCETLENYDLGLNLLKYFIKIHIESILNVKLKTRDFQLM